MGHTGFRALNKENVETALEKNGLFDQKLEMTCATNWHLVEKKNIWTLQIWWNGSMKGFLSKENIPTIKEWIFFHTGTVVPGQKTEIVSRSIGCITDKSKIIITVNEKTGKTQTATAKGERK